MQAVASGGTVGELYSFYVQHPVTLQRRRSAMLPIVNQQVAAEKISIYNQSVHAKHPLNGVYLTNNTGMKLMAGPITVFDGGAYADRTFTVTGDGSVPCLFEHGSAKPEKIGPEVSAFFDEVDCSNGDYLIAFAWVMAENLEKLGS